MSLPIEDYALIGDTRTAALVGKNGSIDWLCLPRFDSGACFAALLGEPRHGRWLLSPVHDPHTCRRRYRDDTLVLETELVTSTGTVRIVDCMPPDEDIPNVVRVVEGVEGEVEMAMELIMRFDYGWVVPWVRRIDDALCAIGGPDALVLRTPVATHGENLTTVASFTVRAGERVPFVLTWFPSNVDVPAELPKDIDADAAIAGAEAWWRAWAAHCTYKGPWRDAVMRSLITLKALTYSPTGGIVAAPTTSLPEWIGSTRNWDYRLVWLRDATYTLLAFLDGGFLCEAIGWRDWLLRAIAGDPSQLQTMYGVAGERRLPELVLDWLPGHAGSVPVRIGNEAVKQFQLDVYGEMLDTAYQARRAGIASDPSARAVLRKLTDYVEAHWREPDHGIWEVRGPRQHFTHSKVMAWVAFDRAVKRIEHLGAEGPVGRWREIRDMIHEDVCVKGYDPDRNTFTQAYGSSKLDASLLLIPLVGFLPPDDPRVIGTVEAIERELVEGGFVLRYRSEEVVDGLPPGEGVFLLCSFWLVDAYVLMGQHDKAHALFERLISVCNDVGLLAEEYDPASHRMLGNFPQAFSHVGLIVSACNLTPRQPKPASERPEP